MVILIGGASHTGKTLLASELVKKLHFSCVSMDHLKMGFIRTGRTGLTVFDDENMIDFLWPFVAEMIKTAIENQQNMIVEGCYIPEGWKNSFSEKYLLHIREVFLVMQECYLQNNFGKVLEYGSVIEKRLCKESKLENLIAENKKTREQCLRDKSSFIEISDSYDMDKVLKSTMEIIK